LYSQPKDFSAIKITTHTQRGKLHVWSKNKDKERGIETKIYTARST
jgi:hypothetical protein